ncbi:putative sulfate exporter family transporter [Actibacterium sp.]|jgi:uncharacterized integral membrane protein (TIGR00698 family)|uniref:YeiH family protein n=1 Tax=Actibacterium sp. TaxID=1872125 RepID=UPI00257970BF|nr:putative sulfate exporter family transporter [Actibacterium sp.]
MTRGAYLIPAAARAQRRTGELWRGVLLSCLVAMAALFLAEHYGGPAMLYALLIGIAFNHLSQEPNSAAGIEFTSTTLLRTGVALLGCRLAFADIAQLGWLHIAGIAGLMALTIGAGVVLSRVMGRSLGFGLISGGAVAICGASAALAIASVIPKGSFRKEELLFTVVGVTAFSTLAMVTYPLIFGTLGLSEADVGYLIGGTIHDVAQVVGAGYMISDTVGDIASFTKLLRIALLPVVLLAISLWFRAEAGAKIRLPWFVAVFAILMLLRNLAPLPAGLILGLTDISRFLLVAAIAALGMKTSLKKMFDTGAGIMAAIAVLTVVLLAGALGFLWLVVR